ncbi:hypothetical protein [Streptomyces sp. NBC_01089]|nr:hypothetical protein OG510_21300 [Streptomyces sp. NBC_01089]
MDLQRDIDAEQFLAGAGWTPPICCIGSIKPTPPGDNRANVA